MLLICWKCKKEIVDFTKRKCDNCDARISRLQASKINIKKDDSSHQRVYFDSHHDYILSDLWSRKKESLRKFHLDNDLPIVCVDCLTDKNLAVHHNYYMDKKFSGEENLIDFDFLCSSCHSKLHERIPPWQINDYLASWQNSIVKNQKYPPESTELTWEENVVIQNSYSYLHVFMKKLEYDQKTVKGFFLRPDVVDYEHKGNGFFYAFLLCLPLIFFYGLGFILIFILIKYSESNKKPKPDDYDKEVPIFREKQKSIKAHLAN